MPAIPFDDAEIRARDRRIAQLEQRVKELEEALRPFAAAWDHAYFDNTPVDPNYMDDYRHAAEVLKH